LALHSVGTTSSSALNAVTFNPANVLSPADLAAIAQGIFGDGRSGGVNPTGSITTGTTHTNTTVDSIASMTGIKVGMFVAGVGIVPGTNVVSVGASSVVLNKAATASASGVNLLFVPGAMYDLNKFTFDGQLFVPRRGVLKVLPGDVVAIDNTGWPILLSASTIALTGSLWSYT
jgi:hypothetical protein